MIDDSKVQIQVVVYRRIEIRADDPYRPGAGRDAGRRRHERAVAIAEEKGKRVIGVVSDDEVLDAVIAHADRGYKNRRCARRQCGGGQIARYQPRNSVAVPARLGEN